MSDTSEGLASAQTESQMQEAAIVLLDLALAKIPTAADASLQERLSKALSLSVQALIMADELRPGATLEERKFKAPQTDVRARMMGVADGLGQAIGCVRTSPGRAELQLMTALALANGVRRRDTFLSGRGF